MSLQLPGHCPTPTSIEACGSRVTCSPPPMNTDRDWLVLVAGDDWAAFCQALESSGWEVGGSQIPNEANTLAPADRFNSFTLGEENIIATCSAEFFRKFMAATSVAKRLNLLDKEDRIALFQAVLYGNIREPLFSDAIANLDEEFA